MLYSTLALLCSLNGVALLYLSWRGVWSGHPLLGRIAMPAGWLLQLIAAALWVRAHGVEFGLTYFLLVLALAAWALVLLNYQVRADRQRALQTGQRVLPGAGALGRQALRFILAVPLAGLVAACSALALTALLPWQQANELSLAILLMPLIWGAAAYWVCADPKMPRPALTLVLILALSGATLSGVSP